MPRTKPDYHDTELDDCFDSEVSSSKEDRDSLNAAAGDGLNTFEVMRESIRVSPKLKELSEQEYQLFLAKVSLGCSEFACAAILGVTANIYRKWIEQGKNANHGLYRRLYLDVCRAKSIARCSAEVQVKKEKPELWLTKFGGRSEPGVPGWTDLTDSEKIQEQQLAFEAGNTELNPASAQQGSQRLMPSTGTFQEALKSLQELGLIQVTEHGKNVLNIQDKEPVNNTLTQQTLIDVKSRINTL